MDDLVNFCYNDVEGHKSLMYVDVTFELGPFFLLLTTYRNTCLFYSDRDTPPAMIGPAMLCVLKDTETYLTLFQKLTAKVPGLKVYIQGFSADGEKALELSLSHEFQSALMFLCYIHSKKNISSTCFNKFKLSRRLTNEINDDIFGKGGLVYAESSSEFKASVDLLKMKWSQLEQSET